MGDRCVFVVCSTSSCGLISDEETMTVASQTQTRLLDLHKTSIKYCEAIGPPYCHVLNKSPDDNTRKLPLYFLQASTDHCATCRRHGIQISTKRVPQSLDGTYFSQQQSLRVLMMLFSGWLQICWWGVFHLPSCLSSPMPRFPTTFLTAYLPFIVETLLTQFTMCYLLMVLDDLCTSGCLLSSVYSMSS